MIKKHISRTLAVFAAAAAVSACGGMAVSAENDLPLPVEEPAAQTVTVTDAETPEIITVDYNYTYEYDEYEVNESSKKNKKKDWVKIILVGLGISIVVTGITVYMIYRSYKYNGMTEPYEYKNKAPLELTEKEDQLVDVHVTKRHINKD